MSAASIDDACDLVAAAYERLAREQDAAERLPAAFDAAIREAIADSRREAAREAAELGAALLAVDAPAAERAATQVGALSLPGSIPSATLRDEWAPAWRAYQAPEAASSAPLETPAAMAARIGASLCLAGGVEAGSGEDGAGEVGEEADACEVVGCACRAAIEDVDGRRVCAEHGDA